MVRMRALANGCSLLVPFAIAFWLAAHGSMRAGEQNGSDREWLIRAWETEDGLPENSATDLVQTADGYLWFGTFNGLVRFDGVKFTVLNAFNTRGLPSSGIVNLHLDKGGRLWVSTYGGLAVL